MKMSPEKKDKRKCHEKKNKNKTTSFPSMFAFPSHQFTPREQTIPLKKTAREKAAQR